MQRIDKATFTFTISGSDWQIVRADGLSAEGYLLAATYRLEVAGATGGDLQVKLIDGPYDDTLSSAQVAAIPDEHAAYDESAITLAASATAATATNIYGTVGESAAWHGARGAASGASANPGPKTTPLLAVKGDGTLAGSVVVCLRARGLFS